MSKITEYAKDKECTARIPGVCNHNPETSVWAHLNSIRWGSGRGHKAPDACGLIVCSSCHNEIDGRTLKRASRAAVELFAYEGHMESLAMLIRDGILK